MEIACYKGLLKFKPVGTARHARIMELQRFIVEQTGKRVGIRALWEFLEEHFDIESLEKVGTPLFKVRIASTFAIGFCLVSIIS